METPHGHPDRSGINRFGEDHIRPDYDDDETGLRHERMPLERSIDWSSDPRSEASRETHSGKGPRNFQRKDEILREEVCEAFLKDADLDAGGLEVEVRDAVVTLRGKVRVREDRYLAEALADSVTGVKEVINHISRDETFKEER